MTVGRIESSLPQQHKVVDDQRSKAIAIRTTAVCAVGLVAIGLLCAYFHIGRGVALGAAAGWAVMTIGVGLVLARWLKPMSGSADQGNLAQMKGDPKLAAVVSGFLQPYLSGKISRDSEPADRKTLMDVLIAKYGKEEAMRVQEAAIDIYIETALYRLCATGSQCRGVPEEELPQAIGGALRKAVSRGLGRAIAEGLQKDFPERSFQWEELLQRIGAAAKRVRRLKVQDALDARELTRRARTSSSQLGLNSSQKPPSAGRPQRASISAAAA